MSVIFSKLLRKPVGVGAIFMPQAVDGLVMHACSYHFYYILIVNSSVNCIITTSCKTKQRTGSSEIKSDKVIFLSNIPRFA